MPCDLNLNPHQEVTCGLKLAAPGLSQPVGTWEPQARSRDRSSRSYNSST